MRSTERIFPLPDRQIFKLVSFKLPSLVQLLNFLDILLKNLEICDIEVVIQMVSLFRFRSHSHPSTNLPVKNTLRNGLRIFLSQLLQSRICHVVDFVTK